MLLYAIYGFLACYSKFVTTVTTELAGRSLALQFNPVSVVVSRFMRRLLRLIWLISWVVRCYCLQPLKCGRNPGLLETSWSFRLVVVIVVYCVIFFCVLLLGVFLSFGGVRLLRLDVLVMWESNLLASQFACCVFYNVRVLVFYVICRSCGSWFFFGNHYD